MIQQAISCDDPVIFYEPKRRYWDKAPVAIGPVPSGAPALDQARVAKPGTDVTLVAYDRRFGSRWTRPPWPSPRAGRWR